MGDGFGVRHVAFDEVDLAHRAQWAQEEAAAGMAGRHLDPPARPGQRPDRVAAQKAGAAENRHQIRIHCISSKAGNSRRQTGPARD